MKPTTLAAIIVVLLIPIGILIATRQPSTNTTAVTSPTPSTDTYTDPSDAVTATKVTLTTDKGDIVLNLYPDKAPMSVKNFVTLGKRGYYNGTFFHRIVADFMIQGGDPTGTGSGGESIWGKGFKTETTDLQFHKGTLGMARSSSLTSNGSQFFIVTKTDQPSLNGQYTVFGQVADDASQAVVDTISAVPVSASPSGENSKPSEQIHVTGFTIIQ
jgi:peptidyl-prolyl cis-trans isomerase A (cyclophilin A)